MTTNPNWTRDELILALDLYARISPGQFPESNPEIIALSDTLNSLPIHPRGDREENFRNPAGVSMKLSNFLALDPSYEGVGLQAGGKLDAIVWDEFSDQPEHLKATASAIRSGAPLVPRPADREELANDREDEFSEGRVLTQLHKRRERSPRAVTDKKNDVMEKTGALKCEVCGFDYQVVFGTIGEGFAECHHRIPLSDLTKAKKTRLEDLAIVCANCHRMLHRVRPWKTVEELREIIES